MLRGIDGQKQRIESLIAQGRLAEAEIAVHAMREFAPEVIAGLLDRIRSLSQARTINPIGQAYHCWYYNSLVWKNVSWLGVDVYKSPMDMWSYQEIITTLRPNLIIEFGAHAGGSALFFADLLNNLGIRGEVISVDISLALLDPLPKCRSNITFIEDSSISADVKVALRDASGRLHGPIFAILDSDHSRDHVYQELLVMKEVLRTGDYLIVEDGNINGHPVLPEWGPGPYEAIEQYVVQFPHDYELDYGREFKFGFTFAPRGFLIRKAAQD